MRLVVKKNNRTVNEFRFSKGPVYIGRHANSQVFLPDESVSRQHAVIFSTQDGKWVLEDLDSANKTYLNDKAIHKVELKSGDSLRITDFTIVVSLEDNSTNEKPIHLEDTLTATAHGPQIIAREIDAEPSPPVRFPAARAGNFVQATEAVSKAKNLDELLLTLLSVASKQFGANNVWCALRNKPSGPMVCHAGKKRDGKNLDIKNLKLGDRITQAVDRNRYLLFIFSRVPNQDEAKQIRSALIAPIIGAAGCLGVIYVDNAIRDEHYSLSDLDYLMLVGVHTATVLQKLPAQS